MRLCIVLCFNRIVLFFLLKRSFDATAAVAWLSQYIGIADICVPTIGRSYMSSRSHSASSAAVSSAKNSDSMDDRESIVCFFDFHDIAAPSIVKMYPPVDLSLSTSEHQLASLKPSTTGGSPL
ncbi:uncharacterized protein M6B38_258410 [Iris pallida]|uniref:Secreted protein n=1 Tax=Iris pallida TaxID=29817 RepID=A0AAX6IEQ3_IRIPA|nr:uncharacterized protein M6B38_258410 [Iris pallida]